MHGNGLGIDALQPQAQLICSHTTDYTSVVKTKTELLLQCTLYLTATGNTKGIQWQNLFAQSGVLHREVQVKGL